MKRLTLFLFVSMGFCAFAQQVPVFKAADYKNMPAKGILKHYYNAEFPTNAVSNVNFIIPSNAKAGEEVIIGKTIYDLQSNSSVVPRCIVHSDGTISTTWTFGTSPTNFPERGTGYQYFDGTNWINNPAYQNISNIVREEGTDGPRTGWSNIDYSPAVGEVIIAHTGTALHMLKRPTKGTGTWTESYIPTTLSILWPRMKIGGTNYNTIHLIALTDPNGEAYMDMLPCMLYSRSQDGGATWDKLDYFIPQIDTNMFAAIYADEYAIDTKGDTVAIVFGGAGNSATLLKSTDNGENWTRTYIDEFPIPDYDFTTISDTNGDGVEDTIYTNDGTFALILDHQGMAHVWYGKMRIIVDAAAAAQGGYTWFPFDMGILYWNENMGANSPTLLIDYFIDWQGNVIPKDSLLIGANMDPGSDMFPTYGSAFMSMPNAGIDANGKIFMIYSCIADSAVSSIYETNCRHLYAVASTDGGNTWSTAVNITPWDYAIGDFSHDYIFPTVGKKVDSVIHLTYQSDPKPGCDVYLESGQDWWENDIVYLKVAKNLGDCNAPLITVTTTNPTCYGTNDGSATVTATGGTPPYTYLWNTTPPQPTPTITGLAPGIYTVTVTGADGCSDNAPAIITQTPPITIQHTLICATCATCNNGSIIANVLGGTPPYDYLWNTTPPQTTPIATGLLPGTYTLIVTDTNGCGHTASITVSSSQLTIDFIIVTDVQCYNQCNGSIVISASGGTGIIYSIDGGTTYQSSNTFTNLCAGNYNIVVTDTNGCSQSGGTVTISQPSQLSASATATVSCSGECTGTATVNVSGGITPYAYSWNTTPPQTTQIATGLCPGNYTVTITDSAGCSITAATTVVSSQQLEITFTPNYASCDTCADGAVTATVSGGTTPYSYQWNTTPPQTTPTATGLLPGTYSLTVTDANGCTFTDSVQIFVIGIDEHTQNNNISLYPNPTEDVLNIKFNNVKDKFNIEIFNIFGQIVYNEQIASPTFKQISLSGLSQGVYSLKLFSEKEIYVYKLIVQ